MLLEFIVKFFNYIIIASSAMHHTNYIPWQSNLILHYGMIHTFVWYHLLFLTRRIVSNQGLICEY